MLSHETLEMMAQVTMTVFVFAFGACAGSLLNVLVYRLPRGLSVVFPTSRCPSCETKLTWRENIPVFGWIFLRGKCRFCKSSISAEYPIVEAIVGLLFVAAYLLFYVVPFDATWLGVNRGAISPEWARSDWNPRNPAQFPTTTWPIFVAMLVLFCSLIAMTIIDARTAMISIQLPWTATIVALVLHMTGALMVTFKGGAKLAYTAPGTRWSLPEPNWWWIGAAIGGVVGLAAALLFLKFGWIRRSFADFDEWEEKYRAENGLPPMGGSEQEADAKPDADDPSAHQRAGFAHPFLIFCIGMVITGAIGFAISGPADLPEFTGLLAFAVFGPAIGAVLVRIFCSTRTEPTDGESQAEMWIQYPHARREMIKELAFLALPVGLAVGGGWLAVRLAGPWHFDEMLNTMVPEAGQSPLWLAVLAGVILGYLIGGAVVWGIRIFGSVMFGKEAMGMGDVHLMAAVGATLGWVDASIAFFAAAFVGLYWTILSVIVSGGAARAMPYGPFLAVGTILVVFCKPLVELGLNTLMHVPSDLPPINLP